MENYKSTYKFTDYNFVAPKRFLNFREAREPARIPPQTPPAGGKSVEAGRIRNPRQIVSPCRVLFSSLNHLDFARNSFELCPTNTAIEIYINNKHYDTRKFG